MSRCAILGLCVLCGVATARADYILRPSSGGATSLTVNWGDTFALDLVLSTAANDKSNSAIFQVRFTEPGLMYEDYAWAAPYMDYDPLLPLDDSTPLLPDLPAEITPDLLSGPGYLPNLSDVELSNVLLSGTFGAGTLATLTLHVPENYGFVGSIYVSAAPDTFANGFSVIPTTAGQVFELIVVPEPASVGLLLGLLPLMRRRPA